MMKIPKEKLGQFGISIKVNRKERLRKYSGASWTQKGFCDGICSEPSFVNIEKGKPGRFIDNYEKMAEKLGMRIAYDPDVDKKIDNYTKHLYKAIEYYDLKKTEKYCDKLIALLEGFKDCLWYGDLYRVVSKIKNYHFKNEFLLRDERDCYGDMIDEFNYGINEILKSIIYNAAYNDFNSSEFIDRFIDFEIEKSSSAFNKVNALTYYFAQDNTSKFNKLFNKLIVEWKDEHNYIRLVDAYNMGLIFLSYYDVSEVDKISSSISEIMDIIEIPQIKLAESYYNLGVAYFELKQYEKTIDMMEISYKFDISNVRFNFVYIGHSQRMLGKALMVPFYANEQLSKISSYAASIYKYYSLPNDCEHSKLEKILMKEVLPLLSVNDEIFFQILREELVYLVEYTKHYKNLMTFDKKINELKSRRS